MLSNVSIILSFFISLLLFPFVYIFLFALGLVNEVCRLFTKIVIKLNHGDKVLKSGNGLFQQRTKKLMLLAPQGTFDDKEKLACGYEGQIQNYFDSNDHQTFSKFQCILATCCGYYCFQKQKNYQWDYEWRMKNKLFLETNIEGFNVRNHFHLMDPNKVWKMKDVKTNKEPVMDTSKPLWDILIFPRFFDGKSIKSLLIVRCHPVYLESCSTFPQMSNYFLLCLLAFLYFPILFALLIANRILKTFETKLKFFQASPFLNMCFSYGGLTKLKKFGKWGDPKRRTDVTYSCFMGTAIASIIRAIISNSNNVPQDLKINETSVQTVALYFFAKFCGRFPKSVMEYAISLMTLDAERRDNVKSISFSSTLRIKGLAFKPEVYNQLLLCAQEK